MLGCKIDLNEYFFKKWPTKFGFGVCSFILVIAFLTLEKALIEVTNLNIPAIVTYVIIATILILHFCLWGVLSGRVIFHFFNRIRVAIHPNLLTDENNLKDILQMMLRGHRIGHIFDIRLLPADHELLDSNKTEKYLLSKGLDLVVWGTAVRALENGKEVTKYLICFSYQFNNPRIRNLLIKDFDEVIKERYWKVNRENSLNEISVLAENISDICLYMISICLLTRGRVNYGLNVLEDLYRKACANPIKRDLFCSKIKNHLISLNNLLATKAWREEKNKEKAIFFSNRTLVLDENNYDCHARLALLEYLNGNIISSWRHVKRCRRIDPRNPCTLFDQGFLYILDKKYDKAMGRYRKLEHSLVDGLLAYEVAVFLDEEYKKNSFEIGFLFASGFVNYKFVIHKKVGLEQLKRFMKLAEAKNEYSDFYNKAKAIIDIEKKNESV